jgi:hypothetical protein
MAGFGLEGVIGRVPCPHCGSTDCCGVQGNSLICISTKKAVTEAHLEAQARKVDMSRYERLEACGDWEIRLITHVGSDWTAKALKKGQAEVVNKHHGIRGIAPNLEEAIAFTEAHKNDYFAHLGD